MKFKFNAGIRKNLLSLVIGVVVISCVSLTIISYQVTKNVLKKNSLNLMQTITEESADLVDAEIQRFFTMGETLAQVPFILDDNVNIQEKLKTLEETKEHFGCLSIGIGDPNGGVIFLDGTTAAVPNEAFYKTALSGKDSVSSPRYSEVLKRDVITYAIPVFSDKENKIVKSVIVFNMPSNQLTNLLKNIKFLNTSSAFMINENGVVIADENENLINSRFNLIEAEENNPSLESLSSFGKKVLANKNGISEYSYNGEKKVAAYEGIKSGDWVIAISTTYSDIISSSKVIKKISLEIMFGVIVIASVIIVLYAKKLTDIIKKLVSHLTTISTGDFSVKIEDDLLNRHDEFGVIAESVDKLTGSIGNMINNINCITAKMHEDSEGLYENSKDLALSTANIRDSISEVAEGNSNQASQINEITYKTEEFSRKVDDMSEYTDNVKKSTIDISSKAESSKIIVDNLEESVKKFSDEFSKFKCSIDELSDDMNKIKSITRIINEISDRTNLLSLNAAIEASRAGDAGRGFAVVAEEIRALAEQSKKNSAQISEIIKKSYNSTAQIVENSNTISGELDSQNQNISDVKDSFKAIVSSVEEVLPELKKVYEGFKEVQHSEKEILNNIEIVSSVSEEVSASSEEILELSTDLSKVGDSVNDAAEKLARRTKTVINQLNKFKIN
ncbi:methyl-accepting chemotaxis sensory transducer with Cache sensor [Clostridium sp. DSM 8431]|uniref:methyl-accepting chemotaxis protein n=1 Tax=Clostridium sp. DSM 8431 TaxID=1761781 RepID=UPI0008E2A27B|nr:methyl-accepting chemotaxis protein [Clostridium sp. DSM 8431]SFU73078.1 methyl-accepting chemotaxis sensory transducer with Cache sensor [Clostridium sp. DSM 8431]